MTYPAIDETHDPSRSSWVASANGHADFPVQNLPLGIFAAAGDAPRPGVAIGDEILDLKRCINARLLPAGLGLLLDSPVLNPLMGSSRAVRLVLCRRVSELLSDMEYRQSVEPLLVRAEGCTLYLPATIGDYSDFYAGIHHAIHVGRLFRPDAPLLPNYKHVPIGYHGRASSVRPSGIPVIRPKGQCQRLPSEYPVYAATDRLDYELELGVWIGPGNLLGNAITIRQAPDHIAGLCLLNDWSARDIQTWEYQPLGPFLAKSFHTTVSPWVVTAEALAPFRIAHPPRSAEDPPPLAYLCDDGDQQAGAFGLELEVSLWTSRMRTLGHAPFRLSRVAASSLYWTVAQLVAHHSSNGCNLNPGDLLGTGTISAPNQEGYGSLLEATLGGRQSLLLPNGERRTFLQDGDEVIFTARAHSRDYVPIGFGCCRARIVAARD